MPLDYKYPRKFIVNYADPEQALKSLVRAVEVMQIEIRKHLDTKQDEDEELNIKYYNQAAEPTLSANENAAFWKDSDGSPNYYLILKTDGGSNVKVELT